MIIYKLINKIKVFYKKYELKSQNKILNNMIQKNNGLLGNKVKFGRNVSISGIFSLKVGNNVHIGTDSFIRANGGLVIGNNVFISRNVIIYTSSHNYKGDLLPFDDTYIKNPIIIEDNVWIGMNVTISPGTIIREGAIIGLGSSIFGEIPPMAIVGSGNLNIIGYRDKDNYKDLKVLKRFCKENGVKYHESK